MFNPIKKSALVFLWFFLLFAQIDFAKADKVSNYREFSMTLILSKPSSNTDKLPQSLSDLLTPIYVGEKEKCSETVLLANKLNINRLDTAKKESLAELGHKKIEDAYYDKHTKDSWAKKIGKKITFSDKFEPEMSAKLAEITHPSLAESSNSTVSVEAEWNNFLKEFQVTDSKKLLIAPTITAPNIPNTAIKLASIDEYKTKLTELLCKSNQSSTIEIYVLADPITVKQPETTKLEEPKPVVVQTKQTEPQKPISPAIPTDQDLYAVIEIGASSIKPVVLHINYDQENDQYLIDDQKGIEDKKYDMIKMLEPNDVNPFHPDSIKNVANDVKEYVDTFQTKYHVPKEHIYIVGSSGVGETSHSAELKQAVQDVTNITMEFVSAEQEGTLVFNGTLKLIPKERGQQEKRKTQVVVIDVGSGNTKGGYYDTNIQDVVPFKLKYGTKSFAATIDKEQGNISFADKAIELRDRNIRPAIKSEAGRVSGLINQKRVYLVGGITWATSTLLSLDAPKYQRRSATGDQAIYTVMYLADINEVYKKVTSSNSIEQVCQNNEAVNLIKDPEKKAIRQEEIDGICSGKFSMKQLIAGLEILKALALELDFEHKNVFFIQNTLYAWPVGYLKEKIEHEVRH